MTSDRANQICEQLKWAILFALVLSALTALRDLSSMSGRVMAGTVELWLWSIASQITLFVFWALLSPIILEVIHHSRDRDWNFAQMSGAHLGLYAIFGTAFYFFVVMVNLYVWPPPGQPVMVSDLFHWQWFVTVMLNSALKYYVPILLGGALYEYYRRVRAEELKAAQLREQLVDSQFRLLKMQLHPHFLFNTLNGITGLVRDQDNAAAVQMLVGLSDLLRQTLDNSGKQQVRLSEELDWLQLYLKLQQMRFSDRLQTRIEAPPETLDALVPNLITQPLVENAIRHGLAPRAAPGTVSLTASCHDSQLELRVCDDGVGLPSGWQLAASNGVGLNNTMARLWQLYGANFQFEVRNRESGGVEAKLAIPLQKEFAGDSNGQNQR